jgi:hypothetical protein
MRGHRSASNQDSRREAKGDAVNSLPPSTLPLLLSPTSGERAGRGGTSRCQKTNCVCTRLPSSVSRGVSTIPEGDNKTKFKEVAMFDEISEIRRTRKKYNQAMLRSGISTFGKFEDLEADALKDGALSRKYKELVALGISITQKCYG